MVPGNSKSLWDAVGASRDIGANVLPASMTLGNLDIGEHERSSSFASYFEQKIKSITDSTIIDDNVYNGAQKMMVEDSMFMSTREVEACIKSIMTAKGA